MSVEVSVRGEHSALSSALTLAGLCHSREPQLLCMGENQPRMGAGTREQRTGREQTEALPWPKRKRQAGRAGERAARVVAGGRRAGPAWKRVSLGRGILLLAGAG